MSLDCGCVSPCTCTSCLPTPCVEGCLTDTKTDCVFLSEDLDICSEILPKGSPVTEALAKLGEAVCDGVTVTVQDMQVKVDPSDTTSGYLFNKLTVGNTLTKTVTNPAGNETLRLDAKLDTITGGNNNILTTTVNGLYVPPPNPTGYNLTPLYSDSVLLTTNTVVGGQSILASIKKDTITGGGNNILQVGANGLYVPPPSTITQTIVTKTNIPNSGIESFVTVASNVYTVSSKILIDPSSTAPISLTADGLKVDCCAPAIQGQTPISIVMPSDSGLNLTATGIDNHTLNASVKVSNASGNALTSTVAGLYCPAPGAAAATTINSTPTVGATLVSPGVYTLEVGRSINPCNALVLGSDNKLYVNGVTEPNSLGFVVDGTDVYFEFQGPTILATAYEVEVQGTTGSPGLWVPATFDSVILGSVLRYSVTTTNNSATIRARVRYKCGTNYSDWVGATYYPPFVLLSESNTVSVSPSSSGAINEFSVDTNLTVVTPTLTSGYTTPDMNTEEDALIKIRKEGSFVTINGVITSNGTSGAILTLDPGYRPEINHQVIFAAHRIGIGVSVTNEYHLIEIKSNGVMMPRQSPIPNGQSVTINITFKAA